MAVCSVQQCAAGGCSCEVSRGGHAITKVLLLPHTYTNSCGLHARLNTHCLDISFENGNNYDRVLINYILLGHAQFGWGTSNWRT